MCTRHFGSVVTQTIRTYKTDQFPLLLVVMGKRTSNEVLNVIQGNYNFFTSSTVYVSVFYVKRLNNTLFIFRQYDSGRADDEINGSNGNLHSTATRGHQR